MGRFDLEYPKEAINTVKRENDRAVYALKTIHHIVNSCQILHVSFNTPSQPFPVILPMIGQMGSFDRPSADISDPLDLYLHGYVSSRFVNLGRESGAEKGLPVCVAASHVDGLVLALTPFSHSYNYRSTVLFGHATLVEDEEERMYAMERITNSVVPDRWRHTRLPPTKAELQSTGILKVKIASGSAKMRTGGPHDDKKDTENEAIQDTIWTGVLPIHASVGEPVASSYNKIDVPDSLAEFLKDFNTDNQQYAVNAAKDT
jgi:nitroimidazol reductase NimA-like FMN-containing flavoprotein (pyridoxamine 5'-phosphate oxidase superfamily)